MKKKKYIKPTTVTYMTNMETLLNNHSGKPGHGYGDNNHGHDGPPGHEDDEENDGQNVKDVNYYNNGLW